MSSFLLVQDVCPSHGIAVYCFQGRKSGRSPRWPSCFFCFLKFLHHKIAMDQGAMFWGSVFWIPSTGWCEVMKPLSLCLNLGPLGRDIPTPEHLLELAVPLITNALWVTFPLAQPCLPFMAFFFQASILILFIKYSLQPGKGESQLSGKDRLCWGRAGPGIKGQQQLGSGWWSLGKGWLQNAWHWLLAHETLGNLTGNRGADSPFSAVGVDSILGTHEGVQEESRHGRQSWG